MPWRGQFSPQLIEYLLEKHCKAGDAVLDPFCGSGTVLYEAARANINSLGIDVNPAAICLARVSELTKFDMMERWKRAEEIRSFSNELKTLSGREGGRVTALDAAQVLRQKQLDRFGRVALEGFLLIAFGDSHIALSGKIAKSAARFLSIFLTLPTFDGKVEAKVGDARSINVEGKTFDHLITSPPYVNVFNYHQNYRPIIEALGHTPLVAARSEIGANRKFRKNRYMTVIQYCMDMAQFFMEAGRVLKDGAGLTIILGRESNVRSVPFRNGEMINAIACEGMGLKLIEWNERKFMNRFGEAIYEDVLTIIPSKESCGHAIEIGRSVGRQALQNALRYCPSERAGEISDAIANADMIVSSQLVSECD